MRTEAAPVEIVNSSNNRVDDDKSVEPYLSSQHALQQPSSYDTDPSKQATGEVEKDNSGSMRDYFVSIQQVTRRRRGRKLCQSLHILTL